MMGLLALLQGVHLHSAWEVLHYVQGIKSFVERREETAGSNSEFANFQCYGKASFSFMQQGLSDKFREMIRHNLCSYFATNELHCKHMLKSSVHLCTKITSIKYGRPKTIRNV